MGGYLKVSMGIWLITLGLSVHFDPWPAILSTIVFLSLYFEDALRKRENFKELCDHLKTDCENLKKADHDYEELRDKVNAISLKLGIRIG